MYEYINYYVCSCAACLNSCAAYIAIAFVVAVFGTRASQPCLSIWTVSEKLCCNAGKDVRVKIKGAHIRSGKGRGHLEKNNRGTYQSNRGTFYVKRGASYKFKGALFL